MPRWRPRRRQASPRRLGCRRASAGAQSTDGLDDECYCGNVNPLRCAATGEGNSACRDVMLAAPGSREPSPIGDLGTTPVTLVSTLFVPALRAAELESAMMERLGLSFNR